MTILASSSTDQSGSERVFAYFREELLHGSLKAGDRLAGERELALRLGVSRPVLREALRSLAMLGFLDIRQGKGAYVRHADVAVLRDFFTFSLAQQPGIIDDVMQARVAIECQAIRLACDRAGDSEIHELGALLRVLRDTRHDPVAGADADFAFHHALVRASGSPALIMLYQAIADLLRRSHLQRRQQITPAQGIRDSLFEAHRDVFMAVVERDADAADRRLRDHFAIGNELRRQTTIAAYRACGEAGSDNMTREERK